MTTYTSTFIPGMGEVVAAALERSLGGVEIEALFDGLVVYRSAATAAEVRALRFCNNSFVCLMSFDGLGRNPIGQMSRAILADDGFSRRLAPHLPRKRLTYRFVASHGNQFVSLPRGARAALERALAPDERLKPNHSNPDVEVWLLSRREGVGFVGLRLTRHTAYEKTLARGELRPELCHLLCLISEPSETDVVLDPFCGSGAIPLERARAFPYREILAGDIDPKRVKSLRAKVRRLGRAAGRQRQQLVVGRWDALDLRTFAPNSLDKFITDPPWGFYSPQHGDPAQFHRQMLRECHRVLRPGGLLVLLAGRPALFERCMQDFSSELKVLKRYSILVSGKKASIFKVGKSAG